MENARTAGVLQSARYHIVVVANGQAPAVTRIGDAAPLPVRGVADIKRGDAAAAGQRHLRQQRATVATGDLAAGKIRGLQQVIAGGVVEKFGRSLTLVVADDHLAWQSRHHRVVMTVDIRGTAIRAASLTS